jgi:hypothetical protein
MIDLLQHFSPMTKASVVAAALFLGCAGDALATELEEQCIANVQGKIAWDNGTHMNWETENLKQLCAGTTKPEEPGKCFLAVNTEHMGGKVSWGGGNNWEWRNIINLCAGSNDAEKSVNCFKNGIKAGTDWREAILICQRALK